MDISSFREVITLAHQPNRHIQHKDGWEVDLHFSQTLLEELADHDWEVRDEARRSVCTRFRKACERKYGNRWMGAWVTWDNLIITVNESPKEQEDNVNSNPDCKCHTPHRCPVHDA